MCESFLVALKMSATDTEPYWSRRLYRYHSAMFYYIDIRIKIYTVDGRSRESRSILPFYFAFLSMRCIWEGRMCLSSQARAPRSSQSHVAKAHLWIRDLSSPQYLARSSSKTIDRTSTSNINHLERPFTVLTRRLDQQGRDTIATFWTVVLPGFFASRWIYC